ncbi:LOW QUALITY PROTEIN: hypothetical protein HID58_067489, partial [Brassica napus]
EESFYTASWACDTLVGHEDSVSEIKTHPMIPQLVLSASKDGSVRLWNVETGICILIFSGTGGHDLRTLIPFRWLCLDTTIKILDMVNERYELKPSTLERNFLSLSVFVCIISLFGCLQRFGHMSIDLAFTWKDVPSKFPIKLVELPVSIFLCFVLVTTTDIHVLMYLQLHVVQLYLISTANEILLWQPQIKDNSLGEVRISFLLYTQQSHSVNYRLKFFVLLFLQDALNILLSYPINHCNHWSIKFSCDLSMNYVSTSGIPVRAP